MKGIELDKKTIDLMFYLGIIGIYISSFGIGYNTENITLAIVFLVLLVFFVFISSFAFGLNSISID